jgi:hypothetical protein
VGGLNVLSADQVVDTLHAARALQIPVLAAVLLGACAAKARSAITASSRPDTHAPGHSPSVLFPVPMRAAVAAGLLACEFLLGACLLLTAGPFGVGAPAIVVRSATALLFGTALGALHVLRGRRPDAGCGCFGDLSDTPVSWQALARPALLCAAAAATIGVPPLRLPASGSQALVVLVLLVVELAVLAALSPEIGEIMVRLGYSEPCEVRRLPVSRTLAALRASAHWRRYKHYLVSTQPVDVWREGCWRYMVFPAQVASRRVEVVFAVYLKPRRAPIRAGIYDATADKRSREGAVADAGDGPADMVPAPRRVSAPGRAVPVMMSVKAPRTAPHTAAQHRAPHHAAQHVPRTLRVSKPL